MHPSLRLSPLFLMIATALVGCGDGGTPADAALRAAIEERLAEGAPTARGNLATAVTCASDALKPLPEADKQRLVDARLAEEALTAMAADPARAPAFAGYMLCVITYFTGEALPVPAR